MKEIRPSEALRRAYQAIVTIFGKVKAPVTMAQVAVLRALEDGGAMRQVLLVEITGIDRTTMSEVLRRLKNSGMVELTRNPQDLRAVEAKITIKGTEVLLAAEVVLTKAEAAMLRTIPRRDRATFIRILRAIEGF